MQRHELELPPKEGLLQGPYRFLQPCPGLTWAWPDLVSSAPVKFIEVLGVGLMHLLPNATPIKTCRFGWGTAGQRTAWAQTGEAEAKIRVEIEITMANT